MESFENLFQIEELEERLEMTADITVTGTVKGDGSVETDITVSWNI
jgi:hypothetical protein